MGALAGMAEEWADRVERWMALSDELCGSQGGPDDAERYFIFQTLAGAWPIEAERLDAYLEKALREAKRQLDLVFDCTGDAMRLLEGDAVASEGSRGARR